MTEGTETTVLLVEDEPTLRVLINRYLVGMGYHVLIAGNGAEALTAAREWVGTIDVVVTDVVMPAMDGFELSERLAAERPDAKVLFMSGYGDRSVAVRGGLREIGRPHLGKPFTRKQFIRAVRRLLGESTAPPQSARAD